MGGLVIKNDKDLRDWLIASWSLLTDLIGLADQLKVKASKEALLRYGFYDEDPKQINGRVRFPLTRRTLYKILKKEYSSRRYKENTICALNNFFDIEINRYWEKLEKIETKLPKNWRELDVSHFEYVHGLPTHWSEIDPKNRLKKIVSLFEKDWAPWEPEKIVESSFQPEIAGQFGDFDFDDDVVYSYKCSVCSDERLSKNANDAKRFGYKTYSVSCNVYKKMSPIDGPSVSISLCKKCFVVNEKLLSAPWTVKLRVLKSRLKLSQKELAARLDISEATLSRFISIRSRRAKSYKYIAPALGKRVISNLIEKQFDTPFELEVKKSFIGAMKRQYGLIYCDPQAEVSEINERMKALGCAFRSAVGWGSRRNASVVFFVETDPSRPEYLEFIEKAAKLRARYLILVKMPSYVDCWRSCYKPKSKNGLDCDLPDSLRLPILCHDLRYFPHSPCEVPQGPSPIKFRRLTDREDPYYQSLDEKIIEFIRVGANKLKNADNKLQRISCLSSLNCFPESNKIKWENIKNEELIYYELELASMYINRPTADLKPNIDLSRYSKLLYELAQFENIQCDHTYNHYHKLCDAIQLISS